MFQSVPNIIAGVTIPSQRRYVEYYAALLSSGLPYVPCKVHVRELVMTPASALVAAACSPELTITQAKPLFKVLVMLHTLATGATMRQIQPYIIWRKNT